MPPFYSFKREVPWFESCQSISNGSQVELVSGDGLSTFVPLPLLLASSAILQSTLSFNHCCGNVRISLPAVQGTTLTLVVDILRKGETSLFPGSQNSEDMFKDVQSVMDMLLSGVTLVLKHHKVYNKQADNRKELKDNVVENLNILDVHTIEHWDEVSSCSDQSLYDDSRCKFSFEENKNVENNEKTSDMANKNAELDQKILEIIEKSDGVWKCNLCQKKSYSKLTAGYHAEIHIQGFKQTCSQCGKICSNRPALKSHMSDHHSGLFNCDGCHKFGMTRVAYRHHKKSTAHKLCNSSTQIKVEGADISANVATATLDNFNEDQANSQPICPICGKALSSKRIRNNHIRHSHPETLTICGICELKFVSKINFEKHMLKKHKIPGGSRLEALKTEAPNICHICDKKFRFKGSLEVHIKVQHGGYKCKVCPMKFPTELGFRKHVEVAHIRVRFFCSECGKKFIGRANVEKHCKLMGHSVAGISKFRLKDGK